ncbi:hypothetical protein C8J56DRAFT_970040 [Mycena floridula]|nr:hypothetical protein C8J56DRAFT_970040 [Mycena floridula]
MEKDLEKGFDDAPDDINSEPTETATYDSAERELWSMYTTTASRFDESLAKNWKGDMDAILIFAGLFTASLTAFIIESYKGLSPDPSTQTVELLTRISLQLSAINDRPESVLPLTAMDSFKPPTPMVICNLLWFLSLGFSLACALTATLVEQWVRHYLQDTQRASPRMRARIRAYLYRGMEQFGMHRVVEVVPLLLHLSLLLFFLGLVIFLYPVSRIIGSLCVCILSLSLGLYMIPSLLPIIAQHSPYRTPLTILFWSLAFWHHEPTLDSARKSQAIEPSTQRSGRDIEAILWLVESFTNDTDFHNFMKLVSPLSKPNGNYIHVIPFLMEPGRIALGQRIMALIRQSNEITPNVATASTIESYYFFLRSILHTFLLDHTCFLARDDRNWFHVKDTIDTVSQFRYEITTLRNIQRDVITLIFAKLLTDLESLSMEALAAKSSDDMARFDRCLDMMSKAVYIFRNPAPLTQVTSCWNRSYPSTLQRFGDLARRWFRTGRTRLNQQWILHFSILIFLQSPH